MDDITAGEHYEEEQDDLTLGIFQEEFDKVSVEKDDCDPKPHEGAEEDAEAEAWLTEALTELEGEASEAWRGAGPPNELQAAVAAKGDGDAADLDPSPSNMQPEPDDPEDQVDDEQREMEKIAKRNRSILVKLNEKQLNQYEAYRRSKLETQSMKKLIQAITQKHPAFNVNDKNLTIVMCGVAKMYVGEIVEAARAIADSMGCDGPLQPSHIRAAYHHLDQRGKIRHRIGPKRLKL
uniref:Transcription initiation factor TFIID subunit 11 n=1 Tax=Tetraselmis sp. GSL018 TaxID=582737 RepID=A0A061RKH3_9CHLO|eukprot:CAMPEP_0177606138 /NCGR_PEP_ID=MMETSP0419_2-20121207/17130_1 /TAXON_ID=582737 /ORGANISM="Tetraselmis sp., Strain GSL018" /LENGTH=235 /DNA_ID=CAMNT_0019100445 /DNA_START=231 /DNA_END=938 /DNA_ORIENTATION=+